MSLKWKINLILVVAFLLTVGTLYAVQRAIVYPSFVKLEEREAVKNLNRGIDGIRREIEHLSVLCSDWAAWDDSWNFVQGKNPAFTKTNLEYTSFLNNHCDYQIYLDKHRNLFWEGGPDKEAKQIKTDVSFGHEVLSTPGLMPKDEIGASSGGVIITSRGPVFVCSRTIVTSENAGPVAGVLIVARRFNDAEVANLSERAQVELKAWPIGEAVEGSGLPAAEIQTLSSLGAGQTHLIRRDPSHPDTIFAYAIVPGIGDEPALLLRADVPAAITAQGAVATRYAGYTTAISGALVIVLVWFLLNRVLLQPLETVTRHAKAVGASDDLTAKLNMDRNDEIGALAHEFDRMVEQLAVSRAAIVDSAHKSGMAEIASEVLHNVGNALNTVNVATQTMEQRLRISKIDGLSKAGKMLADHKQNLSDFLTSDPRGGKLVDYLIGLSEVFTAEQRATMSDLRTLQSRVEHINDVIAVQQSVATHKELIQNLDLAAAVDYVIAMHADQLSQHDIAVEREIASLPPVPVNKSKLVQILVNLVKNGIESIIGASPDGGRLFVRTFAGDDDQIAIEITDTGGGVAPENIEKLFNNGFTTKPSGSGIGLHFCANAIRAMGGTIRVQSAGIGRGATFSLRLPMSRKERSI